MALNLVPLVLDLYDGGGNLITSGTASLTPTSPLIDATDNVYVAQSPLVVNFRVGASPLVEVLPTDNTNIEPTGWAWQITFDNVPGDPPSYEFAIPGSGYVYSYTATFASPAVFTAAGSSLANGTPVVLAGSATTLLGAFWPNTIYYVVDASGDTFSLASSVGGSAIASTSSGSGEVAVVQYLSSLTMIDDVQSVIPIPVSAGGTGSTTQNWQGLLTPTTQMGAYTATAGQLVKANIASSSWTLTLPTAPPANTIIGAKIMANASGNTHALTVACGSGDFFEQSGGGTSVTMSLPLQAAAWQYNSGYWTRVSDDLPLGQLNGLYSEKPATTENTYYVSLAASASDANDGLSVGSAKATVAGALTALGGSKGRIILGYGSWTISSADANGNAISLAAGQKLTGAGRDLTFITINFAATWGIQCLGPYCEVSDLTVGCSSSGTCTYGTGIQGPTTADFSAEDCLFERLVIGSGSGTMTNGLCVSPVSSVHNQDVAETKLWNVYVQSVTGACFYVGCGTEANIVNTYMYGCTATAGLYGVYCYSSNFIWDGGTVQHNGTDFYFYGNGGSPESVVQNLRSENSGALAYSEPNTGGQQTVEFRNITWYGIGGTYNPPTNGQVFVWGFAGTLILANVALYTATSGTYAVQPVISLNVGSASLSVIADGVISSAPYSELFVTQSAHVTVTLTGYMQITQSTGYIASGYQPQAGPVVLNYQDATSTTINGTSYTCMSPTLTGVRPASGGYVAWSGDPTTTCNLTAPSSSTWTAGYAYFYRVDVAPQTVVNGYVSYLWRPGSGLSGSYWAIYTVSGTELTLVDYTADISANASFYYRTIMNQLGVFGTGSYVTPASGVMYLAYLNVTSGVAYGPYYQASAWYNNVPTSGTLPPNDGNYRLMKSGGSQTGPPSSYPLGSCTISGNTTWWAVD